MNRHEMTPDLTTSQRVACFILFCLLLGLLIGGAGRIWEAGH